MRGFVSTELVAKLIGLMLRTQDNFDAGLSRAGALVFQTFYVCLHKHCFCLLPFYSNIGFIRQSIMVDYNRAFPLETTMNLAHIIIITTLNAGFCHAKETKSIQNSIPL